MMKISIQSPEKLSDLENIVDVWNIKNRRIVSSVTLINYIELYNLEIISLD